MSQKMGVTKQIYNHYPCSMTNHKFYMGLLFQQNAPFLYFCINIAFPNLEKHLGLILISNFGFGTKMS